MISTEDKITARFKLLSSADEAQFGGFTQKEWMKSPQIINFAQKYDLENELKHIAAWVWTFKR